MYQAGSRVGPGAGLKVRRGSGDLGKAIGELTVGHASFRSPPPLWGRIKVGGRQPSEISVFGAGLTTPPRCLTVGLPAEGAADSVGYSCFRSR